jgi:primary-amine oxidase
MGISQDAPATAHTNGVNGANGTNGVKKAKLPTHPLGPLTPDEIRQTSSIVAQSWPQGTQFRFKSIKLREPTKTELIPYLEAERAGKELPSIERFSDVVYYIKNTVCRLKGETLTCLSCELTLPPHLG